MIVAAGLGTRLQPLTRWRPKPAVPVRGLPLIAYSLALLDAAGVEEVVINVHHLPEVLMETAERFRPTGMTLHFSHEEELLHTGGAIRRVAGFLRESDPCIVIGGDMIVDTDLGDLVRRHRESGRDVTTLLGDHPQAAAFGSVGLDDEGRLRRIGSRRDLGGEVEAGVYTWVNVLSPAAFDSLPDRAAFNHLDDWWWPQVASGSAAIGGVLLGRDRCRWEPVGTPGEYLRANFDARALSYLDVEKTAERIGARLSADLVLGPGASLEPGARLHRSVVWDDERVPATCVGDHGVFAAGSFHPCDDSNEHGATA
jgi:mannose-1-phosphate guanylyltransferase